MAYGSKKQERIKSFILTSVAFDALNTPRFPKITMLLFVKVSLLYVPLRKKKNFSEL